MNHPDMSIYRSHACNRSQIRLHLYISTYIYCTIHFHPLSISVSCSLAKLTLILTVVSPNVFTNSIWLTLDILSNIFITIGKCFFSFAMFHKIFKLSSICAIFVFELSFTFLPIVNPLPFIVVSFGRSPDSKS